MTKGSFIVLLVLSVFPYLFASSTVLAVEQVNAPDAKPAHHKALQYFVHELQQDVHQITVYGRGNGYESRIFVADMLMLKAAEIGAQYGYEYFTFLDDTYTNDSASVLMGMPESIVVLQDDRHYIVDSKYRPKMPVLFLYDSPKKKGVKALIFSVDSVMAKLKKKHQVSSSDGLAATVGEPIIYKRFNSAE